MDRSFRLKQNIAILKMTPKLVKVIVETLSPDFSFLQGSEDNWEVFDVIGHLIHAEKDDWIPRAKIILFEEDKTFKPFDRIAMFEDSKGKPIMELVKKFETLREKNLETLQNLVSPEKLELTGIHPSLGKVTLDELINTWVIHDLSHMSQILRFIATDYKEAVGPWIEYLRILNENR